MRRAALALLLLAVVVWLPAAGGQPAAPLPSPSPADASAGATATPAHPAAPTHVPGAETGHANPVAPVLLALVVILVAAKLGGWLAERLEQPAVLGELLAGVVMGNLTLVGFTGLSFLAT